MPIYDPNHLEYSIVSGHIHIVLDNGSQLPAYLAYPARGNRFPGIALIHDWWGVNELVRRIANLFAQTGYYVIIPDLYNGHVAHLPQDAMRLVQQLGDNGYPSIHAALSVLEKHHQCNGDVAAVGIGMGGSLAYEAAIVREDLEAAVSYGGFPQRYLGRFNDCKTPILAIYGSREPYTTPNVIEKLNNELTTARSKVKHEVAIINGAGHEFFTDSQTHDQVEYGKRAWQLTLEFLEQYLKGPVRPPSAKTY